MVEPTDISLDGFSERVRENRRELIGLIRRIKNKGKQIVGVSAPAKGNTLLNYCKIDTELLDYIVEINPLKIGKFTPGTHIPVVHEDRIIEDQPEYALLLAWNFKEPIKKALWGKGYRGRFIVPIPEPHIEALDNWHNISL